jgi:Fe-S-cluster containining protein
MIPIPWRYVKSWRCTCCDICCKQFRVVLKFNEWLNLVRIYGVGVTSTSLNKLYLGKKTDGSCLFLGNYIGKFYCRLQNMKPLACKLWPFKIFNKPKYGRPKESFFNYKGRRLFVYIDPFCPQIKFGKPTAKIVYNIIPEFIEIALGSGLKQFHSTAI